MDRIALMRHPVLCFRSLFAETCIPQAWFKMAGVRSGSMVTTDYNLGYVRLFLSV